MCTELAHLIEGYQHTSYLLLFVIGFNPFNIYALLHIALAYGNSYVCPQLGYWIRTFEKSSYLFAFLSLTSTFSCTL